MFLLKYYAFKSKSVRRWNDVCRLANIANDLLRFNAGAWVKTTPLLATRQEPEPACPCVALDQNRYTRPADGSAMCVKVSDFSAAKPKLGALYTKPRYSKRTATFLSVGIG